MPVDVGTAPVRIRLFGALSVTVREQPEIDQFPTQKVALALAYLALRPGEAQSREALCELLWPEVDPAAQRVRLNTVVYNLRRILEPSPIEAGSVLTTGRNQITLRRETVYIDAFEFEAMLKSAAQTRASTSADRAELLEAAVALYLGKLLPGFYEDDILREQDRLHLLCFNAYLDLAAAWNATGQDAATKAIAAARRAVALDPLSEAANTALIQSQANAGQPAAALQSYRRMEALFRQEMDTAPPSALRNLVETLRPVTAPTPDALVPNNVPAPFTSFIGREQETAEIDGLLRETRLLTLSGTGGVGKTRLSLKVAANVLDQAPDRYPDGVWITEFASLADAALVGQTVANTLGVREQPGEPILQTLMQSLKNKRLLLVLDNCEHVVQAAAELAASLLRSCPYLTLLATSREPLGIGGETTFRVPSLSLPDPKTEHAAEALSQYAAVRLFIDRALAVKPAFRITNRNAPALAQICFRLDGIPLAIELAAARVRSLTVEQINDRLESNFNLLTGGDRLVLPRQQTLRALIDWSYDLLSDHEKILLARLSVFAGGWTLEAAESVCGFDPVDTIDVLDLLTSLADKSIVLAEFSDELAAEPMEDEPNVTRYRMLETIRQYAAERRGSGEDGVAVRLRHVDFFVDLAEKTQPKLIGPHQEAWLNRLEIEHDNLRTALDASAESTPLSSATVELPFLSGLRISGALSRFWMVRGYVTEGREQLARAVENWRLSSARALNDNSDDASRVKRAVATALRATGRLAWGQGDFAASKTLLEEALDLHRAVDDRSGVASALSSLGLVADKQGEYAAARALLTESAALYRELGDRNGTASALSNLGLVAYNQGDYTVARARYEESLALDRELGDKGGIAMTLSSLGNVAFDQEDYDAAQILYQDSLDLSRELGDKNGIANTLGNLANILNNQGDIDAARAQYEEGLALQREIGDKIGVAISLGNLGSVARQQGDLVTAEKMYKESLRLYAAAGDMIGIAYGLEGVSTLSEGGHRQVVVLRAAAQAVREEIGAPLPPSNQESQDAQMLKRREALGDAAFTTAWEEGKAMSREAAIELALSASTMVIAGRV